MAGPCLPPRGRADSITVGSTVGAFTLSAIPSQSHSPAQHPISQPSSCAAELNRPCSVLLLQRPCAGENLGSTI